MLILSRQVGERLIIRDEICVTVLAINSTAIEIEVLRGKVSKTMALKKGESYRLDDVHGEIGVDDIRGDKVRLGIDAPRNISVHRDESYDAIIRRPEKSDGTN